MDAKIDAVKKPMNQKELEIQRALGTLNTYNIEISFPRREEPIGLEQLIKKVVPTVIRYYSGLSSCFAIEAPSSYLERVVDALTKLMQNTRYNDHGDSTYVCVWELIDGKIIHSRNFRIDKNGYS